jgi:hypothetical protein
MSQIWVRVRDLRTGHQYDVTEQRLALLVKRGHVEEVEPSQRHRGKARPAKVSRPLGSITPTKNEAAPEAETVAEQKESESA